MGGKVWVYKPIGAMNGRARFLMENEGGTWKLALKECEYRKMETVSGSLKHSICTTDELLERRLAPWTNSVPATGQNIGT